MCTYSFSNAETANLNSLAFPISRSIIAHLAQSPHHPLTLLLNTFAPPFSPSLNTFCPPHIPFQRSLLPIMFDMPILQDVDIPYTERLKLREHAFAWISRDVGGIRNFIFPPSVVQHLHLTSSQIDTVLHEILHNFFQVSTPAGKQSFERSMIHEHASHLRQCTLRLRRNELTHSEVARYAIILESFWSSINSHMSDRVSVYSSLNYDAALIALRIVYIILYLDQEFPSPAHQTALRATVFDTLYKDFFTVNAPTDHSDHKHSSHFLQLLAAWNNEFKLYLTSTFEDKFKTLQQHHGSKRAADILEQFMNLIDIDKSWMLRAFQLEADYSAGKLSRKSGRRQSAATQKSGLPMPQPIEDLDELSLGDDDADKYDDIDDDADFDYDSAIKDSHVDIGPVPSRLFKRSREIRTSTTPSRKSSRIAQNSQKNARLKVPPRPRRKGISYHDNQLDHLERTSRYPKRRSVMLKELQSTTAEFRNDIPVRRGLLEENNNQDSNTYRRSVVSAHRAVEADEIAFASINAHRSDSAHDEFETESMSTLRTRRGQLARGGGGNSQTVSRSEVPTSGTILMEDKDEEGFLDVLPRRDPAAAATGGNQPSSYDHFAASSAMENASQKKHAVNPFAVPRDHVKPHIRLL